MRRQKTFPAGRVCEGEDCTARLSVYNPDHLCASCDNADRLATHEAEALERLLAQERNCDPAARKKSATRFYVGNGDFVDAEPMAQFSRTTRRPLIPKPSSPPDGNGVRRV